MAHNVKENKGALKLLTIIAGVLLLIALVGCCYILTQQTDSFMKIEAALTFVEILIASIYVYRGFKKDAAKVLRSIFCIEAFLTLFEILGYYLTMNFFKEIATPFYVFISMLVYGNFLLLAFGKDLGKTVSLFLSGINSLVYIGLFILGVISYGAFAVETILYFIWMVTALIIVALVKAKYHDKDLRGTE